MTLTQLKSQVKSGVIDTILVAFPDPFGRLVGKRFRADFFLDSVVKHGTHGCNYLLTVNLEMDPLDGFKVASWDAGFGDFGFRPDMATLRILPWQSGAAMALCDLVRESGVLSINSHSSVHVEAPFGGFKQSGLGRDLGMAAMEGYTELKNVYVAE